jgi:His/Glu/Gln/Arg/opine family amino acid ABC transporter permease subunit
MFHFNLIAPSIPFILEGVIVTLQYTFISVCGGLVLGTLLSFCKVGKSRLLRAFANVYTSVFRGTPLLLQLGMVYFALPTLTGITLSPFMAGIITFSLNSGAYLSEILRAGIDSVDKGQREAALSLNVRSSP